MLFDLRGRGRRRTIKIVYITLALLMGGGLVLFGIGGGGAMQGGLVDAITGSSGGDTGAERFDKAREGRRSRPPQRNPQNPAAWAALARARVQSAGIGDNFDPSTAAYTESGKAKLAQAADAWEKYLALEPKNPDDRVAGLMVRAFDQTGLNRPADAVGGAGDHHRGAAVRDDLRDAGDLRLPGRPDPQGRPRAQRGARARAARTSATRSRARSTRPSSRRSPSSSSRTRARRRPTADAQDSPSSRGGRGRGPWLPLAPAPL